MTYTRYRHLAIEDALPAPSAAQIDAIEALLEARLPPAFREYLNAANGGYMDYMVAVPTGEGRTEQLSFGGLYSAEPGTFCDETFIGEIMSEREYAGIPARVLPFARDGGGSIVYLDLTDEGQGRVIAFVKGLPAWAEKRTESAFIELAPSFEAYIDQLQIDRESVLYTLANNASVPSHVEAMGEWLDIGLPSWRSDGEILHAMESAAARVGTPD